MKVHGRVRETHHCVIPAPRRGVLLLVILGLLAMFGLVAVAFVVLSGQALRSAQVVRRIGQYDERPEETLHQAAMQAFVGTPNKMSVLRPHGLLEDLYGIRTAVDFMQIDANDPASGVVGLCGGQLIQFRVNTLLPDEASRRVGCVLTMLDGPAKGQSTRIVDYKYDSVSGIGSFQILAFDEVFTAELIAYLTPNAPAQVGPRCRYLINGTPFSGTGFGFNPGYDPANPLPPGAGPLSAIDPSFPPPNNPGDPAYYYALLPNPVAFQWSAAYGDPAGPGGANEGCDVPDFQNMLLGAQIEVFDPYTNAEILVTIPSLHRPALVRYWMARTGIAPADFMQTPVNLLPDLQRKIVLRPLPQDHPNFTGSNPRQFHPAWDGRPFADIDGNPGNDYDLDDDGLCDFSWDVDNDGDGQPDGIWVDLGLPVRCTPDGRLFKPLISFLCVDLDGRLNLNAHGCLAQADPTDSDNDLTPDYYDDEGVDLTRPGVAPPVGGPYAFAGTAPSLVARLPRGQGYGPAEINLLPLFGGQTVLGVTNYQMFLTGRYSSEPAMLGPGVLGDEPLSWNKWYEYGGNYWNYLLPPNVGTGSYLTPPNPKGTGAIGLDPAGRPLYCAMGVDEQIDDPYELNLSRSAVRGMLSPLQIDRPFTVAELERLLRPFDVDADKLAPRLLNLTWDQNAGRSLLHDRRREITVESRDLPCPNVVLSKEMLLAGVPPTLPDGTANPVYDWLVANLPSRLPVRHLTDLMELLLIKHGAPPASARIMLPYLVPPEMLAGLKMDVNRPLGDGRDNTPPAAIWGVGVVDEPGRVLAGTPPQLDPNFPGEIPPGMDSFPQVDAAGNAILDIPFDHARGADVNGDGVPNQDVDRAMARQLQARYLFVMAMLLREAGYIDPMPEESSLDAAEREELTIRRLAQWAVNVVDFRDADAIMTPFEYDSKPFTDDDNNAANGTWDVDGIISTNTADPDNINSSAPSPRQSDDDSELTHPYRGLVWGCERPELLLTEVTGFHDRRVADTDFDSGPQKKRTDADNTDPQNPVPADPDLDQPRIPQGSAFFELYCPRSPTSAAAPHDLYNFNPNTNRWVLDLGRLAPADPADGTGRQYPVWRIVISESNYTQGNLEPGSPNNVVSRLQGAPSVPRRPHSSSLEPEQFADAAPLTGDFSLLSSPQNPQEQANVDIDRIIWFTTDAPNGHIDGDRIYYNRNIRLPDGTQLPAATQLPAGSYALVGPRALTAIGSKKINLPTVPVGSPSLHQIRLSPVGVVDNDDTNNYPDATSEIKPALGIVVAGDETKVPGWTNPAQAAPFGIGISISEPLFTSADYYPKPGEPNGDLGGVIDAYGDLTQQDDAKPFRNHPLDSQNGPLADDGILQTGTYLNYKTVFLQRLANPLQPYDPLANPYRTVDWMPIDLTVFNGEDTQPPPSQWPPAWSLPPQVPVAIPLGPWDPDDANPDSSPPVRFEARQRGGNPADYGPYNIWAQTSVDPQDTDPVPNASLPEDLNFGHNLDHTAGYLNVLYHGGSPTGTRPWLTAADFPALPANQNPYLGDPVEPFPWVTWNDRPFVSQLELMLVPTSYPGRLLHEFGFQRNRDISRPYDPDPNRWMPSPGSPRDVVFPHMLNFFHSVRAPGASPPPSPQLHRLLELVHVPSRFVGTEIQCNPVVFADNTWNHNFRPPFNWISRYREPGRINLNTIYSKRVFEGLMNGFAGTGVNLEAFWRKFFQSRRGYGTAALEIPEIDPTCPTRFKGLFRSPGGGAMVPLAGLMPDREVNATLLRADPDEPPDEPARALFEFGSAEAVDNTGRNPYFRYQGLERLGNLVTTRSNVYALWITVGYFEVEPNSAGIDAVHPDGYALGQELGIDTGEMERHRAFYIFDRSIPVGFERGKDHNVEKAILLKRFIE